MKVEAGLWPCPPPTFSPKTVPSRVSQPHVAVYMVSGTMSTGSLCTEDSKVALYFLNMQSLLVHPEGRVSFVLPPMQG